MEPSYCLVSSKEITMEMEMAPTIVLVSLKEATMDTVISLVLTTDSVMEFDSSKGSRKAFHLVDEKEHSTGYSMEQKMEHLKVSKMDLGMEWVLAEV